MSRRFVALSVRKTNKNALSCSREGDLDEGGGDAAMYKHKCERALRELEFTRRRLQQQHEDDLEQLVALKKQLEKKVDLGWLGTYM